MAFDGFQKSTPQKNLALTFSSAACLQQCERRRNEGKKAAQKHVFVQKHASCAPFFICRGFPTVAKRPFSATECFVGVKKYSVKDFDISPISPRHFPLPSDLHMAGGRPNGLPASSVRSLSRPRGALSGCRRAASLL